ncbi:MAG: NAD(P)/FAD-dependent oxidoreductase [Lacrimispora sp.]|uniref:NAD(P)/FAD-dependent oxidoreductase n=1 Tax=Lacrimispora sp. TaxID=2719234 RepID=UPI0039E35EA5
MKRIVVLGAGYAGILTAKKLEKKLRKMKLDNEVSISIIDRHPYHTMLTELHEVAAGRVEEDSIRISLKKVFAGRNVEIITDTISHISIEEKKLKGSLREYEYDYLVLAAGSKPTFYGVGGAEEHSYKLWSYEDAVRLKEHIHDVFRKAACEPNEEVKRCLLSFYVVGAGFTGVEMAGELAEYMPFLCEQYEIDPEFVSMHNVDILSRSVPILPEKLSGKVERRLEKMGVKVMMETSVTAIGEDFIELNHKGSKSCCPSATVIWTAGIESADITGEAAETLESVKRGRIQVDSYLRATDHQEVYVVGDNMMYVPEGEDEPVPQMVENCEQSAHTAAHNLVCSITGTGNMEEYKPSFHGVMVSVGGRYGVARVGLPNHMFNLCSFFAMLSKHFINVVYFVQVLGWNKVWSYVCHEFFTIRNRRSFLGGHFSNRTPSFLLAPMRVWLGAVWVFEGIMKILEGWMDQPMLSAFFGGANQYFNNILAPYGISGIGGAAPSADAVSSATSAAGAAADAVASATGAAGSAAEAVSSGVAVFCWNILGMIDATLVSSVGLSHAKLSDYAFKIDFAPMNWFVNSVIIPNGGLQLFMQRGIVIAEILIGLALMAGLFNFLSSAASLVLQVMFVCTTGLYLNTFWMIFAGIAVLIGGGRTLGLDYYAMPWLKKKWRKLPFIRKWYLYND